MTYDKEVAKCDDCQKWFLISKLCTNEKTKKKQCIDCYLEWRELENEMRLR